MSGSRFGPRKKIQWDDDALDQLHAQVEQIGEAVEANENAIDELRSEDREQSAEQIELAKIITGLVKDNPGKKEESK